MFASYQALVGVSMWVMTVLPDNALTTYPPRSKYTPNHVYIPAMPGDTPQCILSPMDTFCVDPPKYPKDRMVYLVRNNMYNSSSFLKDETRDTYTVETKEMPMPPGYGQPKQPSNYQTPPTNYLQPTKYSPPPTLYGPPPSSYGPPSNGYLPPNTSYPRSNYWSPHNNRNSHSAYTNAPNRNQYSSPKSHPVNQPWWKKIMQSVSSRSKRQVDPSATLCPSRSSFIMPRAAQSTRGDWMFLVNVEEASPQFTQLVRSETCIQSTCTGACNVPDGFVAVCQQQYVRKRLVALDSNGESLSYDTFWFPSCCVCKIRPDS